MSGLARYSAAALGAVALAGTLTSCSSGVSEAEIAACEVVIDQATSVGYTMADLVPGSLGEIKDGSALANAYDTVGTKLERSAQQAGDASVREILGTASDSMEVLVPILREGNVMATGDALAPMKELGSLATTCAKVAGS